jgi:uncharacterized protein (TIGR02466 family)
MSENGTKYIFPTPIYISNIGRSFTNQELSAIEVFEKDSTFYQSNAFSNNKFVLNDKNLSFLKQNCEEHMSTFILNDLSIADVQPYITQSWVTISGINGYQYEHYHPNSLFSGIIYVSGSEEDFTVFRRPKFTPQIQLRTSSQASENSDLFRVNLEIGKIVIFPSHLYHLVPKVFSEKRVVIAFNIFVKGELGSESTVDYLSL